MHDATATCAMWWTPMPIASVDSDCRFIDGRHPHGLCDSAASTSSLADVSLTSTLRATFRTRNATRFDR
jgi:hypothetical protein